MKYIFSLLALVFFAGISNAATRIVYINGINVDDDGRVASRMRIENLLGEAGYLAKLRGGTPGSNDLIIETLPNPANGFFSDVDELVQQAKYSGEALTTAKIAQPGATAQSQIYRDHLGRLYAHKIALNITTTDIEKRILNFTKDVRDYLFKRVVQDGDVVIVLAHSQGNFFAEAAHAYLYASVTDSEARILSAKLRFVGAASVASSTPNGRYISADEDRALRAQVGRTTLIDNYSLLDRNVTFCLDNSGTACTDDLNSRDATRHGFVAIYASDLVDKISGQVVSRLLADYISASFDEISAPPPGPAPTVSSASCTAPIVGQAMTCSVFGTNLPSTASFTATNCSPSPMTAVAGGTGGQRQFTCTPVTAGVLVEVSYNVPQFIGPLPPVAATVATLPPPPPPLVAQLNDTGVTAAQCYGAGSDTLISCSSAAAIDLYNKQDGMVGRDVTNNDTSDGLGGFSFETVPNGTGSFDLTECVRDKITGLTWEGKPATGPRAGSLSFTYVGDGRAGDATAYVAYVNSIQLCGHSDWRLPTAWELQGIQNYGIYLPGPLIDVAWFPNTAQGMYWSSNAEFIIDNGKAYAVGGSTDPYFRITPNYVRLVH